MHVLKKLFQDEYENARAKGTSEMRNRKLRKKIKIVSRRHNLVISINVTT